MKLRRLGNSGLEIAPLVFGGNVIGWTVDEPTSFNLLDSFVAAGFNCIDTADVYARWVPGHQLSIELSLTMGCATRQGVAEECVQPRRGGSQ